MSLAPEIPGMYYDKDKNRYFKIQPSHESAGHTVDSVKRRKLNDEASKEEERDRISLMGPIKQTLRLRECGTVNRHASMARDVLTLVNGWSTRDVLEEEGNVESRPALAFDNLTGALYYPRTLLPHSIPGILGVFRHSQRKNHLNYQRFYYQKQDREDIFLLDAPIKTIEIEHRSRMLLASWQCDRRDKLLIAKLGDTQTPSVSLVEHQGPMHLIELGSRRSDVEIFAATPAPPQSNDLFAIATSGGLYVVDKMVTPRCIHRDLESSTHAVESLQGAPVVVSGKRNGAICVHDLRTNPAAALVSPILHPSSIAHVKSLDQHKLVVAGPNSTLCNYDLRFSRRVRRSNCWPDLQSKLGAEAVTMPVLKYPTYGNDAKLDFGFDIDRDQGLVAAASQNKLQVTGDDIVKIFSSATGDLLRTVTNTDENSKAEIKALRFVAERGDSLPKSLWVSKGKRLISYGW